MTWQFDSETGVSPTADGSWETHIRPDWNIGVNPNGGYAAAALLGQMLDSVQQPMPISVTTHYLRPALPDAVGQLEIDILREGRTTSTVSGRLVQEGKERLRTIGSFGDVSDASAAAPSLGIAEVDLPPPDECPSRGDLDQGIDLPIMSRVDVRIDPAHAVPGAADEPIVAGWIRLADGRPPDVRCLPLFCDAFPPSVYSLLGRVGWVPTLELTVHVRRPPADGWVRARFETRDLAHGLMVEDGVLWDQTGAVVAQSRQLALLRSEQ